MRRRSAALVAVLLLFSACNEATAAAGNSTASAPASAAPPLPPLTPAGPGQGPSAAAAAATGASVHPGDVSDAALNATLLDSRPRSTAPPAPPGPPPRQAQSTQGTQQGAHGQAQRSRTPAREALAGHGTQQHPTAHTASHAAAATRSTKAARGRLPDDADTSLPSDDVPPLPPASSTRLPSRTRDAPGGVAAASEEVHAAHGPQHAANHAPPHPTMASRPTRGMRVRTVDDADGTSSSFPDETSTTTNSNTISTTTSTSTPSTITTTSTTFSSTGRVMSKASIDWEDFKRKNSKSYLNRTELNKMARMARAHNGAANLPDLLSDEDRMNLFVARKMAIEEHNKNVRSFKRSVNHFADMTTEEVITKHTGLVLSGRRPRGGSWDSRIVSSRALAPLPRRFDWRERGALTEARNQGPCGCCWAFAATAAIEAKIFIRTKKLVALSEQHLLDCDNLNDKCDGGTPWDAFDWVQANGGQEENEKYPYEVLPDSCRQDKARMYRLQVKGYMSVGPPTEENIMAAVYLEGPLTVAVNALPSSLQDYQEGVYADPDCSSNEDDLHHAMVLVGWGDDPSVEGGFWILRNSWGRDWGENGYIRMSRKDNLCGVMTYAVFPSLE